MRKVTLLLLPLLLLLYGAEKPFKRDTSKISGNLNLTLKRAIWKEWEGKRVYQDLTLDLVCLEGKCQKEIWGYAPKFNPDVEQEGVVTVKNTPTGYLIEVDLKIQSHPWDVKRYPAKYQIEIVNYKKDYIGNYTALVKGLSLQGAVKGKVSSIYPTTITSFQPTQEHPRLIFRASQLEEMKEKAKTASGKAILERLKITLSRSVQYGGYVPQGGYHATGYCFLALLEDKPSLALPAWAIVLKSMKTPGKRIFEQAPLVAGIALAYDTCYPSWTDAQRTQVKKYLAIEADLLSRGSSVRKGWNSSPNSNWFARVKGASGLAALAIMGEDDLKVSPQRIYTLAKRNLVRYLNTAIGERAFGSEGDHYTTEPWILTVLPFIHASRQVMGEDFVTNSNVEWFLPHYLTRIVPTEGNKISVGTYGRHRYYAGGPLFALGLATVPPQYFPTVFETYQAMLGNLGDRTFGVEMPYHALYALAALPKDTYSQDATLRLPKVMVDEQKGFYVFRNAWDNKDDFVTTFYVKHQALNSSWSFPEVGSFRIGGLGTFWAKAGPTDGKWESENSVSLSNSEPFNRAITSFFVSDRQNGSAIISLQSEPVKGIALLRSFAVDYSNTSGSPALFAIVDRFTGSTNQSQPKVWSWHTEGEVKLIPQGFIILSKRGNSLKATFITPSNVQLSYQDNVIKATGGDEFFVVMTIQNAEAPPIKITGKGLDALVKVGKQTVNYERGRLFFDVF